MPQHNIASLPATVHTAGTARDAVTTTPPAETAGRDTKLKISSHADFKQMLALWPLSDTFVTSKIWSNQITLDLLVRVQAAFRGAAVRKRLRTDRAVLNLLAKAAEAWEGPHAAARPPLMREGDVEKVALLRQQYFAGKAQPGVFNPYANAVQRPFAKAALHLHTPDGEILRGQVPTDEIVRQCKDYALAALVANKAVVPNDTEGIQKLADELGVHLLTGAELLFESGVGPHFGYFPEHPELAMAYHPSMGVPLDFPVGENCPAEVMFTEQLAGVHYLEVANGYVRLVDPEPASSKFSWRADDKWDRLLSDGCLMWGVGNGDEYQGIRAGMLGRAAPVRIQSALGLAHNVICLDPSATKEQLLAAVRSGCFYFSTGVNIINVSVSGTVITVETSNAHHIVATTDHGINLAHEYATKISFDPWECLAKRRVPVGNPTYVRVTCSRVQFEAQDSSDGRQRALQEYAWTQPFWLTLDGFSLARDRRSLDRDAGRAGCLRLMAKKRFGMTYSLRHEMVDVA